MRNSHNELKSSLLIEFKNYTLLEKIIYYNIANIRIETTMIQKNIFINQGIKKMRIEIGKSELEPLKTFDLIIDVNGIIIMILKIF